MRKSIAFVAALCVLAAAAEAKRARFVSIDIGGNNFVAGINAGADVVGGNETMGFVRRRDGTLTTFAAPGADATTPSAIADNGTVVGSVRTNGVIKGFLRDPGGHLTTFALPGNTMGTFVSDINAAYTITGQVEDSTSLAFHGYVRTNRGVLTLFDGPGSSVTNPRRINETGEIAGWYFDAQGSPHGFLRDPDGTITTVDVPGSTATSIEGLNDEGWTAGAYVDGGRLHGFLRAPEGTFTLLGIRFDACCINNEGVAAGARQRRRGFVRAVDGTIDLFKIPVHAARNTAASGINDHGIVVGNYSLGRNHDPAKSYGFIRFP